MKQILVFGDKTFKLTLPEDVVITFGPWSPPSPKDRGGFGGEQESKRGTLRIYRKTKANIVAVFSGVKGFRDLSLGYAEEVAREEGAVLWKDDEKGYTREEKLSRTKDWVEPAANLLPAGNGKKAK